VRVVGSGRLHAIRNFCWALFPEHAPCSADTLPGLQSSKSYCTQETRGALHCNFRSLPCSALLYLMFALNRVGTVTGPFDVFITCSPFQLASPFPFLKKKKKTRTPRPSQSALGAASAAAQ
jgi:hypothetical protein